MDKWISMMSKSQPFLRMFQKKKRNTGGMFWASLVGMLLGAFFFGSEKNRKTAARDGGGLTSILNKVPQMTSAKKAAPDFSQDKTTANNSNKSKGTSSSQNLANLFKNVPELSKVAGMAEISNELGLTARKDNPSAVSKKAPKQEASGQESLSNLLKEDPEIAQLAADFSSKSENKDHHNQPKL